jgi:signal transduction histidine kinase
MRLSLSARLLVGIGILVVLLVGQGTLSVILMDRDRVATAEIASSKVPVLEAVYRMELQVRLQTSLLAAYGNHPDPDVGTEIESTRNQYRAALIAYELFEDKKQVALVKGVLHTWYEQFEALGAAMMNSADALALARTPQERTVAQGRLDVDRNSLNLMLNDFERSFDSRVTAPVRIGIVQRASDVRDQALFAVVITGALAVVALVAGVVILFLLRRGLARPLARLSQGFRTVAGGRLDLQITDEGIREFRDAAEGFNTMAGRLAVVQRELRHQLAEQSRILDTIPTALLILGKDRKIGSVYSKEAPLVLGTEQLAGRSLSEVLFARAPDHETRALLDRFLHQLFENTSADPEMFAEINPVAQLDYRGPGGGAEVQNLEIQFDRIMEDDAVEGVLVDVIDRTDARKAEEALASEQIARRRDADTIEAILNHGPNQLQAYLNETREQLKSVRAGLVSAGGTATLEACFRKLHSIKGSSASLGLEPVVQLAHQAETLLEPRRNGSADTSNLPVNRVLGAMGEELDSIENLVGRLRDLLLRAERGLEDPTADLVGSLKAMVGQLGKTLTKELVFEAEILTDKVPALPELRQIIVQLVRNAADHGIEDSYERLFRGKNTAGTIRLTICPVPSDPTKLLIEVSDDGAGLDYKAIEAKARALKYLAEDAPAPPRNSLLRYLFRPGFTTRTQANEISGRGVGLDLVKETIDGLGGTVQVASEPGKGTKFRVIIPA